MQCRQKYLPVQTQARYVTVGQLILYQEELQMSEIRVIENEQLIVKVCDHGAELFGLYDKANGREVLWQADPKHWARHAPILFPFVGKCQGGFYTHNGADYPMGQHGFARDMEFEFAGQTEDSITHVLRSTEETLAKYPFSFELKVTHKIAGKELAVQWEVVNTGDEVMYFSIGGHPAFNVPAREGESKFDYFVTFGGEEKLNYLRVDLSCAAADIDHPQVLEPKDNKMQITEHMFDQDAFIFDDHEVKKVGIAFPDGTPYVTMTCEQIPSMGVWSMPAPETPFVCLEPWIGRCDNKGFAGELKDKYGVQKLEAGKKFNAQYEITLG